MVRCNFTPPKTRLTQLDAFVLILCTRSFRPVVPRTLPSHTGPSSANRRTRSPSAGLLLAKLCARIDCHVNASILVCFVFPNFSLFLVSICVFFIITWNSSFSRKTSHSPCHFLSPTLLDLGIRAVVAAFYLEVKSESN